MQYTATPLIDLSLYVSAENYNTVTSAAYTAILPWHTNYTVPPKRRELARVRTAHMGLSSLDVDTTAEEAFTPGRGTASSEYEAAKRAAGIPTDTHTNTLSMGHGKGLGGFLRTPVYAARFRLDALSNELFEPLSDLLGESGYLLGGDQLSSLDCLAYGYLALLLFPAVPQAWLKETIKMKYPRIEAYMRKLRKELFSNEEINAADVWSISTHAMDGKQDSLLPWQPRSKKFTARTMTGLREIAGNIPLISSIIKRTTVVHTASSRALTPRQSSLPSPLLVSSLLSIAAAATVGLTSLAVHHRRSPHDGMLIFWALRPSSGFGEAGNILSVLADQIPRGGVVSQF